MNILNDTEEAIDNIGIPPSFDASPEEAAPAAPAAGKRKRGRPAGKTRPRTAQERSENKRLRDSGLNVATASRDPEALKAMGITTLMVVMQKAIRYGLPEEVRLIAVEMERRAMANDHEEDTLMQQHQEEKNHTDSPA